MGQIVQMPVASLVGFSTLCLIWGLSWVAIKYSLDEIPPFLGVGARFALAAVFLAVFARLRRRPLSINREDVPLLARDL